MAYVYQKVAVNKPASLHIVGSALQRHGATKHMPKSLMSQFDIDASIPGGDSQYSRNLDS